MDLSWPSVIERSYRASDSKGASDNKCRHRRFASLACGVKICDDFGRPVFAVLGFHAERMSRLSRDSCSRNRPPARALRSQSPS